MRYEIREMQISDIEAVVAGEEKIFKESLGYDMLLSELTLSPYAYYFVLEIDKKVRGYIGTWIDDDRAEIVNFYIDEEYQGMGFGNELLGFIIKLCDMSNVECITLEVREHNEKAKNLYKKHGFVFSHKREQYYKDLEDALVLIRKNEVIK